MLKQIKLDNLDLEDELIISEIVLKNLKGVKDFNHNIYQLSWEIIVTRGDTYK
jgi:hypothetical protein